MGASFGGGASQTVFGSSGGGNVLTSATGWLSALFFATSFGLAMIADQQFADTDDLGFEGGSNYDQMQSVWEEDGYIHGGAVLNPYDMLWPETRNRHLALTESPGLCVCDVEESRIRVNEAVEVTQYRPRSPRTPVSVCLQE